MVEMARLRHLGVRLPRSVPGCITPADCETRALWSVGVLTEMVGPRHPRVPLRQSVQDPPIAVRWERTRAPWPAGVMIMRIERQPLRACSPRSLRGNIPADCKTRALWSVGVQIITVRPRRLRARLSRSVRGSATPAGFVTQAPCSAGVSTTMVRPPRPLARLCRSMPAYNTPASYAPRTAPWPVGAGTPMAWTQAIGSRRHHGVIAREIGSGLRFPAVAMSPHVLYGYQLSHEVGQGAEGVIDICALRFGFQQS